jgi:DAACS family dicarboxylate/amino acid:cation (Na+ or H+) symporter
LKLPLYMQTLIAMVAGLIAGLLVGEPILELAPISKWLIEIIKAAAIPLLFLAILDGILRLEFKGKGLGRLAFIIVFNATCAITIALVISNVFEPGRLLPLGQLSHLTEHGLGGLFKQSDRLVKNPMPIAIVSSLVLGISILVVQKLRDRQPPERLRNVTGRGFAIAVKVLGVLVKFVPIAVFVAVSGITGSGKYHQLTGLLAYFLTCVSGLVLHMAIVYQGWLMLSGIGLGNFWRAAKTPVIYAFGINSSLATLPVTLKALDELKVSSGSARMSACLGTNFNNDGILLYEVAAVLFMAQAYGLDLSIGQQISMAGLCVIAMLGVGGIPEAGIISLTLVCGTVGLPTENIPLLLAVDWFIARLRSVTNVLGDMTGAVVLDWLAARSSTSRP